MPEEIILRPIAPLQKATQMHMKHGAHKMDRISLAKIVKRTLLFNALKLDILTCESMGIDSVLKKGIVTVRGTAVFCASLLVKSNVKAQSTTIRTIEILCVFEFCSAF